MGFDSLFVGVSGLEAYQNQLDVISNNIANVSTTGYKEQNVNFEDLLYQAQQYATAPTTNNGGVDGQYYGLGVKVGSIDTNFSEGGMDQTGVNTNLAINGDGFFILQAPGGSSAPVYTRNGDFSLNENGLMYDPSTGYAVQGWMTNADGQIETSSQPGDINIPLGLSEQAVGTGFNTTKLGPTGDQVYDAQYSGNLDQSNWQTELQDAISGTTPSGSLAETVTTTLYDSLGNAHTATITYTPDATGASGGISPTTVPVGANNTALNLVQSATGVPTAGATGPLTVTLNAAGTIATVTDGATPANTVTGVPGQSVSLDGVTLVLGNFTGADGAAGSKATVAIAAGVNTTNTDVTNTVPLTEGLITSINGVSSTYTGKITASVNSTGTSATISDGAGNSVSGVPGQTVTIDGIQVTLGDFGPTNSSGSTTPATATFAATAYEGNLPSSVDNVDGTAETPATRWSVNVSFSDGTTFDAISNAGPNGINAAGDVEAPTYDVTSSGTVGYVYFNADGQYINSSSTIGAVGAPPGGPLTTANGGVHVAATNASLAAGDQLNIENWGVGDNATAPTSGSTVTASKATAGPIGLSYADMTSLATANTVTTLAQNGYAAGTLDNITIGTNGIITGAFTNGQNQALGQVALASFQNEEGLEQMGSSYYQETANSGLPQVGTAASGQYGTINSGDLEESNVDLASEFTKMISAQNAYQANSKSITVASQDIQTAVNLIPGG
jgi:flagellar hook protein FlgE